MHKNIKKITAFIFAVFVVLIAIFIVNSRNLPLESNTHLKYNLNGKEYKLLIADEPHEWQQGLMYYRKLDNADGMIFIFPTSEMQSFWNKNTYMDLDLYWVDDGQVVGKSFLPSIEKSKEIITIKSPKKVNKVIEIVR